MLVDGENVDRTLGQILAKKPKPEQRPRWDKVKTFIEKEFQAACRPLFFLNANDGVPGTFIQALKTVDFIPIPLTGPSDIKIVDSGIIKTLQALKTQTSEDSPLPGVALVSHDADFKEDFAALKNRHLAIVGFNEYLSGEYMEIPDLRVFDLEQDIRAFKTECGPLPRERPIRLEDFDPFKFI
jgi:uncharacterized protein